MNIEVLFPGSVMVRRFGVPRYDLLMAYELFRQSNARLEVRCVPGNIVPIAWDPDNDTWTVEEDESHQTFRNQGDALDRARLIGKDPDFK